MSLTHEKRVAPSKATPLPTAARQIRPKITIPVDSDFIRNRRPERFSVTLGSTALSGLLSANAMVVFVAVSMLVGGHRG